MIKTGLNPNIETLLDVSYPDDIPKGIVRLHLMENPYPLPANLQKTIVKNLEAISLNRYPETTQKNLKEKLRHTFNIPTESDIILGNGSFEILQNIFLAFNNANHCFLAYQPSFFFFFRCAHLFNQKMIGVRPNENIIHAIEKHQPSLIIIDNPNNPMGTILDEISLEKIIQAAPGYVLIDEAYFPYGHITMMPHLAKYPNLIIVRSVSKIGLAGLRLGFLCCHPDLAASIKKVAPPFNINAYTASAISTVLDNFDVIENQTQEIIKDRDNLYINMQKILGNHVTESHTNFINFSIPGYEASDAFDYFLKNNILLFQYRTKPPHPLANHLRVSIGTPDENKKFLGVLTNMVSNRSPD